MLEEGVYDIPVTLVGGTGRASIESPAKVTIGEGTATARIVWSSPYYDYMLVDGQKFLPLNAEGNSVFEIPVSPEEENHVTADTVAMSEPHEIAYTITFDTEGAQRQADKALASGPVLYAFAGGTAALVIVFFVLARRIAGRPGRGKRR